jgi:hypothetical protein
MNRVEVLEVDAEFFMQFNPWKQPEGAKLVRSIEYNSNQLSPHEFIERLSKPRFDEEKPKRLFKKIKEFFTN